MLSKQYALYSYVFLCVVHLSGPPAIWDIELQTDPSNFCIPELSFLGPEIFLICSVLLTNANTIEFPLEKITEK